jgi:hypothetical protein
MEMLLGMRFCRIQGLLIGHRDHVGHQPMGWSYCPVGANFQWFIYFICGLFNNTVSSSDSVALNDKINE